jgi:sugar O-acyltransferase (sialic acid O-acetyltransferase NeuD family)
MLNRRLIILGFGGHARSIADVALTCGYGSLVFVDENAKPNENFLGHPVVKFLPALDGMACDAISASGDNAKRESQCQEIKAQGLRLISLISPLASIGRGSIISEGCLIAHHSHVGPMASIGRGSIVNTGAIVEHESVVGDFSHISVKSVIAGRSKIGSFSMLGAGGVIIDGLSVGSHVVLGAGAVVCKAITEPGVYVGIPASKLK